VRPGCHLLQSTGALHLTVSSSGKISAAATLPAGTYDTTGTMETARCRRDLELCPDCRSHQAHSARPDTAATLLAKVSPVSSMSPAHAELSRTPSRPAPDLRISSSGKVLAWRPWWQDYKASGTSETPSVILGVELCLDGRSHQAQPGCPETGTTVTGMAFSGQLKASGAHGTVTYAQSTGATVLKVSSSGKVSAGTTIVAGTTGPQAVFETSSVISGTGALP